MRWGSSLVEYREVRLHGVNHLTLEGQGRSLFDDIFNVSWSRSATRPATVRAGCTWNGLAWRQPSVGLAATRGVGENPQFLVRIQESQDSPTFGDSGGAERLIHR